jgi:D-aminopeptidase
MEDRERVFHLPLALKYATARPSHETRGEPLEMSYKNYAAAEIFSYLPGMERVGSRTVKYVARNITEAVDVIMVAESYQPDVSP